MIDKIINSVIHLLNHRSFPRQVQKTIRRVRDRNLTYLSKAKLNTIVECGLSIEKREVPGIMIEAGCALGGSAITLASIKKKERELFVYDVFDTIPQPSEKDGDDVHGRYEIIRSGQSEGINGDTYYGYVDNLYDRVLTSFVDLGYPLEEHRISLVKGLLQDTLEVKEPVSLAHIDVDWYEPVMTCLRRIEPNLSVGGVIIIDDYSDWSGCRQATDEYFETKESSLYEFDGASGSLVVRKRQ